MKIGSDQPGRSRKTPATTAGTDAQSERPTQHSPQPVDPSMKRLSELADATRRDLVAKSTLQTSMKDRLLVSRNRAAEIRQRIQDGYYSRPDIVRSIADRLADFMEP